jgi:hypothetical protein
MQAALIWGGAGIARPPWHGDTRLKRDSRIKDGLPPRNPARLPLPQALAAACQRGHFLRKCQAHDYITVQERDLRAVFRRHGIKVSG